MEYTKTGKEKDIWELLERADHAKRKLALGMIDLDEAKEIVGEYIEEANMRGKAIAKQFGKRFAPFSVSKFLR